MLAPGKLAPTSAAHGTAAERLVSDAAVRGIARSIDEVGEALTVLASILVEQGAATPGMTRTVLRSVSEAQKMAREITRTRTSPAGVPADALLDRAGRLAEGSELVARQVEACLCDVNLRRSLMPSVCRSHARLAMTERDDERHHDYFDEV